MKQSRTIVISKRRLKYAFSAFAITASVSASAGAGSFVSSDKGADISTMCGTKPTVVALTDGYGNNTWRRIVEAELRDEAAKCKNITRIIYADAGGDQQKGNSDINSVVAQGANVLLVFTDFGDATIPAMRRAYKSGVTVVPYFSQLTGKPGKDYSANVYQDQARVSESWADWLNTSIKKGNVVFLGGSAGAAISQRYMNGFKEGLKKYPDLKLLSDNYVVTNWNAADTQKAVAGLIAKYGHIDAIVTDWGVTTLAVVKAYEQAGLPVPAQATLASQNELSCKYLDAKKAGKPWQYFSLDGTSATVRVALRRGMADYQGTQNPEPAAVMPFVYVDSVKGKDPQCDPSAPPDADLSSLLAPAKLKEVFRR